MSTERSSGEARNEEKKEERKKRKKKNERRFEWREKQRRQRKARMDGWIDGEERKEEIESENDKIETNAGRGSKKKRPANANSARRTVGDWRELARWNAEVGVESIHQVRGRSRTESFLA